MAATAMTTRWALRGRGYEFCNCDFGCGCNFGGFPSSKDGSCRAFVGCDIASGSCIRIEGEGRKSTFIAEGVGEGRGDTFKNPVTGEDHLANIDLPDGFIWKRGECGQGSFQASASGVSIGAQKSNWILYDFDWSNA